MKYYIASGIGNAQRVNQAAAALNANGHQRTYDWTTHGSVAEKTDMVRAITATNEAMAVTEAELAVFLLPGRFGTHAELGIAISSCGNKRIIVWSETDAPFVNPDAFCVFYYHPAVERMICPFEKLLDELNSL